MSGEKPNSAYGSDFKFYPEILMRYINLLREPDPERAKWDTTCVEYASTEHLISMLERIGADPSMSDTKRHRWLGYVQGIMVLRGIIDVDTERNYTRPIFNGV